MILHLGEGTVGVTTVKSKGGGRPTDTLVLEAGIGTGVIGEQVPGRESGQIIESELGE